SRDFPRPRMGASPKSIHRKGLEVMPDGRKRWTLTMGSSTSLLPTAIFLLLFSARHPHVVGECVAGLTLLCQQSDIALSFSRLLRISSRATVRRNPGEPFLLVRFRARGDASKILTVPSRGCRGFGCLLLSGR